jgi:3-hydroxyisobutyrate dehydrogenase
MTEIGFVGLGNMGLPMAQNLIKAGHSVRGFDMFAAQVDKLEVAGGKAATSADAALDGARVLITMLPSGKEAREVYLGEAGLIARAKRGHAADRLLDHRRRTARAGAPRRPARGLPMLDAPVSGGVGGAQGRHADLHGRRQRRSLRAAKPLLEAMGKTIVHAGGPGNGQAAKICNNMILGITMIAVSEAFVLAEKLGLDAQKLFDIASKSSGQCWSLTTYCPVPGPVPTSPANRDYRPASPPR